MKERGLTAPRRKPAIPGRAGLLLRLVAATALAGLIVGTVGAVVQWRSAQGSLRAEIMQRNSTLVIELAARLDGRVQNLIALLELVASRPTITPLDAATASELQAVIGSSATFDELVLYDRWGNPVAAAASRFLASAAEEPARPDLVSTVAAAPAVALIDGQAPALELSVAVQDPPGVTIGALVARTPLEIWASPALRIDVATATTRFLVRDSGEVMVHPERDWVIRGERLTIPALTGSDEAAITVTINDGARIVALAPLQSLPLLAVVSQRESVAMAPVLGQLRDLTGILSLVMIATVGAVAAAGTWLLAPLQPLTAAVGRLGRNERGVRVREHGAGEVGLLAAEFNRLAEVLDRRHDELSELQHLSLLVNTRTSRDTVAAEVADGVSRLLHIEHAVFCTVSNSYPEIAAAHGRIAERVVLEQATTVLRVDGTHRHHDRDLYYAGIPVRTVDGRLAGALVVARSSRPISDEELALAEAYAAFAGVALENVGRLALERDLTNELSHAAELRRALVAMVLHGICEPVEGITDMASGLLDNWDGYDDTRRRDLVDRILQHGRELNELTSGLVAFAATERSTSTVDIGPVPLSEAVDDVLATMAGLLAGRSCTVDVGDVVALADAVLVRRIMFNLIANALKYSSAGTPVEIRAVADGSRVRLEVTDEGVGLTPDEASMAFEPFWRSGPASRHGAGGGVGLALVAEYARAMGGAVGVLSEPGHGSTFFVTLRAAAGPADRPPLPLGDGRSPGAHARRRYADRLGPDPGFTSL